MNERKHQKLTIALLIIYLVTLTWIIVCKLETNFTNLGAMRYRNINLIPYKNTAAMNGQVDTSELFMNVLAFVPFGIYVSMLYKNNNLIQKIIPIFGTSLLYEVLQYLFAIGATDITDLINNTLGGILGIALYVICSKIFRSKTTTIFQVLCSIGTLLMLALLTLLIVTNL